MLDFDFSDYSFEYAAVLPEQLFADRHKCGEPVERLMFAVLNDAIRCYQTNVGVQRPHRRALRSNFASGNMWDRSPKRRPARGGLPSPGGAIRRPRRSSSR